MTGMPVLMPDLSEEPVIGESSNYPAQAPATVLDDLLRVADHVGHISGAGAGGAEESSSDDEGTNEEIRNMLIMRLDDFLQRVRYKKKWVSLLVEKIESAEQEVTGQIRTVGLVVDANSGAVQPANVDFDIAPAPVPGTGRTKRPRGFGEKGGRKRKQGRMRFGLWPTACGSSHSVRFLWIPMSNDTRRACATGPRSAAKRT